VLNRDEYILIFFPAAVRLQTQRTGDGSRCVRVLTAGSVTLVEDVCVVLGTAAHDVNCAPTRCQPITRQVSHLGRCYLDTSV